MSEVIGNMPPEQFQQLVGPASGAGIPGGIGGMRGMGGGTAGRNVIHLTEEEGASVTRLAELGFDRTDAVQVGVMTMYSSNASLTNFSTP